MAGAPIFTMALSHDPSILAAAFRQQTGGLTLPDDSTYQILEPDPNRVLIVFEVHSSTVDILVKWKGPSDILFEYILEQPYEKLIMKYSDYGNLITGEFLAATATTSLSAEPVGWTTVSFIPSLLRG